MPSFVMPAELVGVTSAVSQCHESGELDCILIERRRGPAPQSAVVSSDQKNVRIDCEHQRDSCSVDTVLSLRISWIWIVVRRALEGNQPAVVLSV